MVLPRWLWLSSVASLPFWMFSFRASLADIVGEEEEEGDGQTECFNTIKGKCFNTIKGKRLGAW
jgi:hypothetical protein